MRWAEKREFFYDTCVMYIASVRWSLRCLRGCCYERCCMTKLSYWSRQGIVQLHLADRDVSFSVLSDVNSVREREMETSGTNTMWMHTPYLWDRSTELQSEIISIWSNFTPYPGNNHTTCARPYFFLICFFAREKYFSFTSQELHFRNRFRKIFFTQIYLYVIFFACIKNFLNLGEE